MLRLLLPPGNALSEREVLKRCLQGEDVHCVWERVLRIGKVGQVGADICVRWLVGGKSRPTQNWGSPNLIIIVVLLAARLKGPLLRKR